MSKNGKNKNVPVASSVAKRLLQLEGIATLAVSCALYAHYQFPMSWFAIGFLVPDISMVGYLANKKVGAAFYNSVHTYVVPVALGAFLFATHRENLYWIVLVWTAHIGFDRFLGYGLKYNTDFKSTHLQKV